MELNRTYCVNIVSRRGNCTSHNDYSFVIVEKFNTDSSRHFQNYYNKLLTFNRCGEWFQNLDYPQIEIGKIVIARIDKKTNLWGRGIISKCETNASSPEIYLIDFQRFCDNDRKYKLKICPTKFSQLILPTYNICVNLSCNNDDGLQNAAINMLINKNQYGELHFYFTPKSVQNNIYYGELTVNNQTDDLLISLKKLLKNIHRKQYFQEISKYKHHKFSIFNPFNFKYLQNIFMPRDPTSIIFFDKNLISSYSDLNNQISSLENPLYDSSDEFLSTKDSYEYSSFSDDSTSGVQNPQVHYTIPIAEQKTYSSFSSSINTSNSSIYSTCYFEKDCSPELNLMINRLYDSIIQGNNEQQDSIVSETIANRIDKNKSSNTISTTTDIVIDAVTTSACFETNDNNNNNNNNSGIAVFKIKQNDADQEIEANISKEKLFVDIETSIKQQSDCLPKLSKLKNASQCLLNNNFTNFDTTQKEIPSNRLLCETKVNSNTSVEDSNIWWSSDDESY